jgi:beta-lactamase regulating signal transducer with metallopeptidase domain
VVDQQLSKELPFIALQKFRVQNKWKLANEKAFRLTFITNEVSQYAVAAVFFAFPKIPDSFLFEEIVYKKNITNSADPCEDTCAKETEACCNTLTFLTICTCVVGVIAVLICAFKDLQNEANVTLRRQRRQARKARRAARRRLRKLKKAENV